jgi:glycosyltransferase involved in cell wall biosynthesis
VTHVQVLLSTYNGARHLPELLASILRQQGVRVDVLARDDGSRDETWAILQAHECTSALRAYRGTHLGAVDSFFQLLQDASPRADYLALADQDDVWLDGKLARAVALLSGQPPGAPAMYCSRLMLTDDALMPIGYSEPAPRGPSFANSLVQNIATGCTIVLNRPACEALLRDIPHTAFMHDWWIYQVVAGLGSVVYDDQSFILYRQHGGNVIGAPGTALDRVVTRVRRGIRRGFRHVGASQLEELDRIHGSFLPPRHRDTLRRHLEARRSIRPRLELAFGSELVLQYGWQGVMCRCLLLLNRL